VTLRPYRPPDWPRLCEIHDAARLNELRLSAGEAAFLTLEQTAENEGLFAAQLVVAEQHGIVQGFVAYSEEELTWLYVAPSLARRGVGRALLRHACAHAGLRFTTEVLEGNAPALNLYRSEGFRIERHVKGRRVGNEGFAASGFVLVREAED
jgi:ribosomal protein S18 acetylase RimI-like enzyme